MKKTYMIPAIKVTDIDMESALLQESGTVQKFSKEHENIFNDWSWDDEDNAKDAPKQKSLWD